MDKKPEQPKLFELKQENKVLTEEEIQNSADKKTGQLKFINKNTELKAIIREEMQPILENNILLAETAKRLTSSFEKAIPHFQNKMIGNEDEAYLSYSENSEQSDVTRVSSDKIPSDIVYSLISVDLAKAFGCESCYVSMLLKDMDLWDDTRFSRQRRVNKSGKIKEFRKSITDEVFKRFESLIGSEKWNGFTEKRKSNYSKIYETMKFYRS